ncbi:MAG: hypothetical protein HY901_34740 [Deltaproteobacteria bacterium]|nr:hypothetical protein [Deltaproteobacteria bacterium]
MRFALLCAFLLAPAAVAASEGDQTPFPLPLIDGKPLAVVKGQTTFRLPMKFARAESFFREQFKGEAKIAFKSEGSDGARVLTLRSSRSKESWHKAVVKEGEVDTLVEVSFIFRANPEQVGGRMPPILFIPRSSEVSKAVDAIDHMEKKP